MNALVITDLHATDARPLSQITAGGQAECFQDLLDVLTQVESILEQRRVTDLIIAGDLTHRRHFIKYRLLNPLWDALYRLAERVEQTTIIPGNHDYEDDETHSLHVLEGLPNTSVITLPGRRALASDQEIFLLPWLPQVELMVKAMETAPGGMSVVGHYGAEGCPMETDYWLDLPLKVGELARFPQTIFGHIHKPGEQLGGKVIYVGAPLQFDFGDHGPRGVVHWTNKGVERIWLNSPEFVSGAWPRLPLPPEHGGYLRILDVPQDRLEDAVSEARRIGWRACVPIAATLPTTIREAVLSGMVVDRAMVAAWVAEECSDLDAAEQRATVDTAMELWEAVQP